jgi:hypothetical protein
MARNGGWVAAALMGLLVPAAHGGNLPVVGKPGAPGNPLALLGGGSTDALAGSLRGYLIQALPKPLYEDQRHWGLQKPLARGVTWKGQGAGVHAEVRHRLKNEGHWWKVRVTAGNLPDTLVVDLRDVQQPEPGRVLFTAFVSFDTQVEYDRQNWRAGVRLYSGSVRARLRVKLTLRCEAVTRLEPNGTLLPDALFRLRVLQSDLSYDNLVVEHVAGVGGEAAKVLGDTARGSLKHWRPSLERDLLAKANAAIVKAGDTKEVRFGLANLLGKK